MTGVHSPEVSDHDWDIDDDANSDEFGSREESDHHHPADNTVTPGSGADEGD
jgi:hypothetical protein